MLEFYYHPQSPPSCVVWMLLKELGIDCKENIVDFFKAEHKGKDYAQINPRMQVPAIKDGDFVVTESRAIAIYLCSKFEKADKKNKLYPTDFKERTKFLEMMMRDVDNYHVILKYLNAEDVFGGESQSMVDPLLPKCESILKEYDQLLSKKDFAFGSHITFLDFAWTHTVNAMAMSGNLDWAKYPNLERWRTTLSKLPYFKECVTEPSRACEQLFQLLLEKGPAAYPIFLAQKQKT